MVDVTQYDSLIKQILVKLKIDRRQKEDMTQECYVALLENTAELESDPNLAEEICHKRVSGIIREQKQEGVRKKDHVYFVSADDPSVAARLARIGIENSGPISESELYAAIETLNPEDREVIKLIFIDGLTQLAAADKLKITARAVRWRSKRGIMELRQKFEVPDGH